MQLVTATRWGTVTHFDTKCLPCYIHAATASKVVAYACSALYAEFRQYFHLHNPFQFREIAALVKSASCPAR